MSTKKKKKPKTNNQPLQSYRRINVQGKRHAFFKHKVQLHI